MCCRDSAEGPRRALSLFSCLVLVLISRSLAPTPNAIGIASFPFGRYCQIKFYDESKKKTKTIKKTLEPQWNEPEVYNWTGTIASLLERIYAKIDVYDKDMLRDDFMGRIYLQ